MRCVTFAIACLSIAIAVLFPRFAVADPTFTTALYYDKNNKLLQIEDLSGVDLQDRLLQEISEFPIPRLTQKNHGSNPPCPGPDTAQKMSKKARYAIYYGEDDPNNPDEHARPLKLEYVIGVDDRDIACMPPNGDTACSWPLHCQQGCTACPGYCCIK